MDRNLIVSQTNLDCDPLLHPFAEVFGGLRTNVRAMLSKMTKEERNEVVAAARQARCRNTCCSVGDAAAVILEEAATNDDAAQLHGSTGEHGHCAGCWHA